MPPSGRVLCLLVCLIFPPTNFPAGDAARDITALLSYPATGLPRMRSRLRQSVLQMANVVGIQGKGSTAPAAALAAAWVGCLPGQILTITQASCITLEGLPSPDRFRRRVDGACVRCRWVGIQIHHYKSSQLCCGSTGEPRLCSFFSHSHTVRLSGCADLHVLNVKLFQSPRTASMWARCSRPA